MKQIYWKTIRFQLMKLLPGLLSILLSGVLLFPVSIWCAHGLSGVGSGLLVLLWAIISGGAYYFIVHYYGYLFQTAFVAATAEYAVNQALPSSYRDFVQEFVKGQFQKPADYQYLYHLVADSMKELHKGVLWKDWVLLKYLTQCGLCINFYKKKAGKYKSIADTVVLYTSHQKKLLSSGLQTGGIVVVAMAVVTLVAALLYGLIPAVGWFAALILGLLTAGALKYAFLDSWFLTKQLLVLGQLDQIAAGDAYEKLSAASHAFRKLYHKVRREQSTLDAKERLSEFDFHSLKFCGECGALVAPETESEEQEEQNEQTDETETQGESETAEQIEESHEQAAQEDEENQGVEGVSEIFSGTEEATGMEGTASDGVHDTLQTDGADSSKLTGQDDAGDLADGQGGEQDWKALDESTTQDGEKVVFCGECGAAIFPGESFCGECGTPAQRCKKKQEAFCGECGNALVPGEKFCGECGAPVNVGA